jgi:hypothetical protein
MKWLAGAALAGGLLVGSLVSNGVSAQTATPQGSSGASFCPGFGMMGAGFGPGASSVRFDRAQNTIASALGVTSQQLWDARGAGKSVADLAKEKNVDLTKVAEAALAVHGTQLDSAVNASMLTRAQADAMKALMKSRIENQFQTTVGSGPWGNGMLA